MSQVELFVLQDRDMQEAINTLEPLWLGLGARDQLVCSREFELGSKWLSGPPFPGVETSRQQPRSSAGQPGAPPNKTFRRGKSFRQLFFCIACSGYANLPPTTCRVLSHLTQATNRWQHQVKAIAHPSWFTRLQNPRTGNNLKKSFQMCPRLKAG